MAWTKTMMAVAALTTFLALPAAAEENRGLGEWKGTGVIFGTDGEPKGAFEVELVRAEVEGGVETKGTVRLPDGRTLPVRQLMRGGPRAFELETNRGRGGGFCFGAGLCETYEDAGDGKAFATTIVLDGADRMRLLTTELREGKAVAFIRQELELRK